MRLQTLGLRAGQPAEVCRGTAHGEGGEGGKVPVVERWVGGGWLVISAPIRPWTRATIQPPSPPPLPPPLPFALRHPKYVSVRVRLTAIRRGKGKVPVVGVCREEGGGGGG